MFDSQTMKRIGQVVECGAIALEALQREGMIRFAEGPMTRDEIRDGLTRTVEKVIAKAQVFDND